MIRLAWMEQSGPWWSYFWHLNSCWERRVHCSSLFATMIHILPCSEHRQSLLWSQIPGHHRKTSWTVLTKSPGESINYWHAKQSPFRVENVHNSETSWIKSLRKWIGWQNCPTDRQNDSVINIPSVKWIDQLVKHPFLSDWIPWLKNWPSGLFACYM